MIGSALVGLTVVSRPPIASTIFDAIARFMPDVWPEESEWLKGDSMSASWSAVRAAPDRRTPKRTTADEVECSTSWAATWTLPCDTARMESETVSYTHLRAHET